MLPTELTLLEPTSRRRKTVTTPTPAYAEPVMPNWQFELVTAQDRPTRQPGLATPSPNVNALERSLMRLQESPSSLQQPPPSATATRKNQVGEQQPHKRRGKTRDDIANSLHSSPLSASERRAYPRRESGCVVSVCRLDRDGSPAAWGLVHAESAIFRQHQAAYGAWQAHATDLSGELIDIGMQGIAFRLPRPIDLQERLVLRLSNPNFAYQFDIFARVLRCMQVSETTWNIVCQFEDNLPFDQIQRFGQSLFRSQIV